LADSASSKPVAGEIDVTGECRRLSLCQPLVDGSPQSVGSWRCGGVYGHSWFVDPARQLSLVLLTNTAIASALPDAIRDATYGAL